MLAEPHLLIDEPHVERFRLDWLREHAKVVGYTRIANLQINRRFKISNILYTHVYLVYMEDIWLHHRTHLGSAELSPKLSRSALTFDDKNIQN